MIGISIICPSYNHAEFLPEAVNSVLDQEYQNWELLIIDDGSTDDTFTIARFFCCSDDRIKYFYQDNKGLSSARNVGVSKAKGQILHFLDADDKVMKGAYRKVDFLFFTDKNLDVLVGGYSYFNEKGHFHNHEFASMRLHEQELFTKNIAPPVAFFVNRDLLDRIGDFDPVLRSCEDWDFWIRAAKAGAKIKTISDILAGYRYVPNSMSRNPKQMFQALLEVSQRAVRKDFRIVVDHPNNRDYSIDISESVKSHFIRCLGVNIMQGSVEDSITWFHSVKEEWNFTVFMEDFAGMNSYLTFRYFLNKEDIRRIFLNIRPNFELFFVGIGYSGTELRKVINLVFSPQIKKLNHLKYGRVLGAFMNRIQF